MGQWGVVDAAGCPEHGCGHHHGQIRQQVRRNAWTEKNMSSQNAWTHKNTLLSQYSVWFYRLLSSMQCLPLAHQDSVSEKLHLQPGRSLAEICFMHMAKTRFCHVLHTLLSPTTANRNTAAACLMVPKTLCMYICTQEVSQPIQAFPFPCQRASKPVTASLAMSEERVLLQASHCFPSHA